MCRGMRADQRQVIQPMQSQPGNQRLACGFLLGLPHPVAPVRVPAEDDRITDRRRFLPERLARGVAVQSHSQQVDLQRHAARLCLAAQPPRLCAVQRLIADKVHHVRVGKAGERPRIQRLHALVCVLVQARGVIRLLKVWLAVQLIAQKVLSQNEILILGRLQHLQQPPEVAGVILRLKADMYVDIPPVLVAQCRNRADILGCLVAAHPESGAVAVIEGVGRMVGEAQHLQSGVQRRLHVGALVRLGVVTTPRVGVVVGFHHGWGTLLSVVFICAALPPKSRPGAPDVLSSDAPRERITCGSVRETGPACRWCHAPGTAPAQRAARPPP